MMAELNMCFKTSESILMWHQYQIMLENGRLVSISKSEYSHYVDGKFGKNPVILYLNWKKFRMLFIT